MSIIKPQEPLSWMSVAVVGSDQFTVTPLPLSIAIGDARNYSASMFEAMEVPSGLLRNDRDLSALGCEYVAFGNPEDAYAEREAAWRANQILERLSPLERETLVASVVEERNSFQIGGDKSSTARMALRRAKYRFRLQWQDTKVFPPMQRAVVLEKQAKAEAERINELYERARPGIKRTLNEKFMNPTFLPKRTARQRLKAITEWLLSNRPNVCVVILEESSKYLKSIDKHEKKYREVLKAHKENLAQRERAVIEEGRRRSEERSPEASALKAELKLQEAARIKARQAMLEAEYKAWQQKQAAWQKRNGRSEDGK